MECARGVCGPVLASIRRLLAMEDYETISEDRAIEIVLSPWATFLQRTAAAKHKNPRDLVRRTETWKWGHPGCPERPRIGSTANWREHVTRVVRATPWDFTVEWYE